MSIFVSPVNAHPPEDPKPPGVVGNSWCYMVSSSSLADLQATVVLLVLSGVLVTSIRTPALGSGVTYVALTSAQRTAALGIGAQAAPTEGKARAKAFDGPATSWEP